MIRASLIQNSFTGGELSPRMLGRSDVPKYSVGAETMSNFIPAVQGPAVRRSGTRFVSSTLDGDSARIIPFVASDDESFVLSFTEGKVRFYTKEAVLLDGSGNPVELSSPYLEDELFDFQYAQTVDVLYIAHKDHAPRKISRVTNTSWTIETVEFFDGPYNVTNTTDTSLTWGTVSAPASLNVTASASLFSPSDVGRMIRLRSSALPEDWSWGVISTYNSDTDVDVDIEIDTTADTSKVWRLGAWYEGNYPRSVSFNDQRLIFGGDPNNPQAVYASVVDDFENFRPSGATGRTIDALDDEVVDDNAFRLTLAANDVNPIQWIQSTRSLLLATVGGLWEISASSDLQPLTPSNAGANRSTERGGRSILPAVVGNGVIYASSTGRRLFRAIFSLANEAFVAEDLTLLSEHLLTGGVKQMAYAGDPDNVLWIVTDDGKLVGVTIDQQQEVLAFHRHDLGGTDVAVESVAVIPAAAGSRSTGAVDNVLHDQLWLVVRRTIDGVQKRYIEFMEESFGATETIEDAYFVDCGLSYEGVATTSISGLDHLEGEDVVALADGSVVSGISVSSGSITLNTSASRVHVGLPYTSRIKTVRLEVTDRSGNSAQGRPKRVDHVMGRFYRTAGGEVSASLDGSEFDPIDFDDTSQAIGTPPDLFTGDVTTAVGSGYDTGGQVEVQQPHPLPMMLLGLVLRVQIGEGSQE